VQHPEAQVDADRATAALGEQRDVAARPAAEVGDEAADRDVLEQGVHRDGQHVADGAAHAVRVVVRLGDGVVGRPVQGGDVVGQLREPERT
jgi:hypothetical protein